MISRDRSKFPCHAVLLLTMLLGLPRASGAATLEDSAKEMARKAAAELRAGESVAVEVSNRSSLRAEEVSRIQQAFDSELRDRGFPAAAAGGTVARLGVTLSENWQELVWTVEIHEGDAARAFVLAVARTHDEAASANAMHVTVRGEKFWEGPERILDAGQVSSGTGKSWLVLLLPDALRIEDLQSGSSGAVPIATGQNASREPIGKIDFGRIGSTVAFALSRVCTVDLDARSVTSCLPVEGSDNGPAPGRYPLMIDLAPGGAPPQGKGLELAITPVCGGASQFLATSARDDTQPDSLQVFQSEPSGPVAISGELDFPGPIVALHSSLDSPRAIARNLATGNYEAYTLAISCGQ